MLAHVLEISHYYLCCYIELCPMLRTETGAQAETDGLAAFRLAGCRWDSSTHLAIRLQLGVKTFYPKIVYYHFSVSPIPE